MPFIRITQTPAVDDAQRANIIAAVTAAYAEAAGKDPAKVWVAIDEVPREHFGVGGTPLG